MVTAQRTLRLGFIGLGQAIQRILVHDREILQLPYRMAAAADPREDARAAFRREFGGVTYVTAEELCSSPEVDVVYVATPPEMHREHVEMAAQHGKHVIVEKPMALDIQDCLAMNQAAERHGVRLLAGHTHSFDTPIRRMTEIVNNGDLGELVSINTWNYNEFNARPWPSEELRSTYGPLLNQGPHQVDIVRQLGGGLARSVRARTIWDSLRECVGGYTCYLEFASGVPATLHYDARGFFDTAELYGWVNEGGDIRDPTTNRRARSNYRRLAALSQQERERELEMQKDQGRFGAETIDDETRKLWGYWDGHDSQQHQKFFGLTVVNCDRGAIRQSADGLLIYDDDGEREIPLNRTMRSRAAEFMELYESIVNGKPLVHDGRWGQATLEVCLAILQSSAEQREITLQHQVPLARQAAG